MSPHPWGDSSVGKALGGDRTNPSTAEGQEQAGREPLVQQIRVGIQPCLAFPESSASPSSKFSLPCPAMGNAESEQRIT